MQKKLSQKILAVVAAIAVSMALVPLTQAAALTGISDTMSNQNAAGTSNHTVAFTTTQAIASTNTITLTFPASSFTMAATVTGVTIADNGGTANAVTSASWNSGTGVLTITASASSIVTAGHVATIVIPSAQITNPGAGTYVVAIAGTFGGTGSFAVPIIANDQVTLSATVNTSITFSLSATASNWAAALSTGAPSASATDVTITAATNMNSGYNVYVADAGSGATPGLYNSAASYTIPSATALLANGVEGYGIQASTGTGATLSSTYNKSGLNVGGLTLAAQTLFSRAAANTSNDTVLVHHIASISPTTKAGTYADTITYVASASF